MRHIFREYDIRGIFEKDLNERSIKIIGYLLGKKILKFHKSVAVGYDARAHSKTIFDWLLSGLNKAGIKVKNLGLVPTPCNYFASYKYDNAGVMI
ncbi:MAG: phosphomannomutase/phosphoglucomutase, partial [Campylobacteraceae bacterium]|nr:phosphomannomutase/phosphoglucomutase [Campylobacteraceae bacterium]